MAGIKPKVKLARKNDEAFVPVSQLAVTLRWSTDVDLDLMVFFKAKDGTKGGVFSEGYPDGNLGSLENFPFMRLSGDAGLGATGGDNAEEIKIAKLEGIDEVYVVTINYTDAVEEKSSCFADYDGSVSIVPYKGQGFTDPNEKDSLEIPLTSRDPGHVAVICKIDNMSAVGPKVINMNDVMSLSDFAAKIPGASLILTSE